MDVVTHLLVLSWGTYWSALHHRFDFLSTVVVALAQMEVLSSNDQLVRYLNALRMLRLAKVPSSKSSALRVDGGSSFSWVSGVRRLLALFSHQGDPSEFYTLRRVGSAF